MANRALITATRQQRESLARKAMDLGFHNPKHVGEPSLAGMVQAMLNANRRELLAALRSLIGTTEVGDGEKERHTIQLKKGYSTEELKDIAKALGVTGAEMGPMRNSTRGNVSALFRILGSVEHDAFVEALKPILDGGNDEDSDRR